MSTDAHTVVAKLISILESGFGDSISASNKSRLELAGNVLSGLITEAEPLLTERFDMSSLLDAIAEGEDAIVSGEESARKLIALFGKKETNQKDTQSTATTEPETTPTPSTPTPTESHTEETPTTSHPF